MTLSKWINHQLCFSSFIGDENYTNFPVIKSFFFVCVCVFTWKEQHKWCLLVIFSNYFNIFCFPIIIDLQCSVNFCCTAKWQSYIYIYTYIYINVYSFSHYPPSCSITWPDIVSCTIQQDFIAYPLQMQEFASTNPKLQSIPLPSPPPLQPQVCSPSPWVCFFSLNRFICAKF